MTDQQRRRLGKTDLEVTPVGLGCWQFSGGTGVGSFWGEVASEDEDQIVRASLDGGIDWFDTAEMYGRGRSERSLARALERVGKKPGEVLIATKWFPIGRTASSITKTIDERIRCLAPYPIDLHQIHNPMAFATVGSQMKAMAELVHAKKIRAVGVSNFSERSMRKAGHALESHGLTLATNQVHYSLAHRAIESNGVLRAAKEMGTTIIAYSPLEKGLLSGKFHEDPKLVATRHGPRKLMPAFRSRGLRKSQRLIDELRSIAQSHDVTPARVALAWLIQFHGDVVVVIPGATKERQVADNVGAMRLKLSNSELAALDEKSRIFL